MTTLNIDDHAPDFTLPTDNNDQFKLSDHQGKKVIIYFYPKDNTPGCTTQACAFRDEMPEFGKLNITVVGISKCSVKKHNNFKIKHDLNFSLLSDENGSVCEQYGTWAEKSMYGKKFMGINRTTFLVNENGKIENIWQKVKVKNHIQDIKDFLNIN